MAQITRTFRQTTLFVQVAALTLLAVLAIISTVLASQLIVGGTASVARHSIVTGRPAGLDSRAAVMSELNSEYLRDAATEWFGPAPTVSDRAASVVSQLNSEYLREVAPDWFVQAVPAANREASVMGALNSEYLRQAAAEWFPAEGRILSQLNSEYLREIARDW